MLPTAATCRYLCCWVDDHRLLRESLERALTDEGFDVVGQAANGADAVRLAAELAPDVVLLDVTMPVMDGVDAAAAIHEARHETRIVMLTMHADASVVSDALRAGACGYLTKDSSTDEIYSEASLLSPKWIF